MSLTGLTIDASSTVPSRAEFSTFLKDGVIDVTSKWLIGHPQDRDQFTRESAETTSNASLDLGGADIIAVIREDGVASNNWRPCRKISVAQQYIVTDTESLSFASEVNPVYMIGDTGKISVFPAPGSDPNAFKAYYINNSPVETGGSALDHASTGIEYFPSDKIHLVVLYASIKSLHSKMTSVITDLSAFSVSTVIADTVVSPGFTYTNASDDTSIDSTLVNIPDLEALSSAPTYTPPKVTGDTQELTATIVAGAPGTTADFINFEHWFDVTADYIETKEDTELAGVQLNKISTYIQAYQSAMQNQLHEFNEANVKYQAEIQEHMQEAQNEVTRLTTIYNKNTDVNIQNAVNSYRADVDEYSAKLQKYQADIQAYSAEVNTEVQEQATKLQTESARYQWLQDRATALQAEYVSAFATPQPAGGGR